MHAALILNLDCDDGDVRLHGGSNYSSIGHVYYCVNRSWVGVCSDGWDRDEIGVVCRQLHYYPEGMFDCELESIDVNLLCALLLGDIIQMEEADSGEEPLFLRQVSCTGSEQGLSECSHDINTWNCTRVALSCVETLSENYYTYCFS